MIYYYGKIILVSYLIFLTVQEELIKMAVPEFICDKNNDVGDIRSDTTTISVLGEGSFDFKLNFIRIGQECRNVQRCNLMAWKVIRDFEKYLNNYPYKQSNSIVFNNTMLMPGLKYFLNVFATNGAVSEQKQFTLNFVDENVKKMADKPLASVVLLGPQLSEAHITYVANAETTICSNITDFYFEWQLLDESNNILETFSDRGSELSIPPFTFQSNKNYNLKGVLINMENDQPFAKNTISVKIKNTGETLIVKLPMLYTTVNVKQLINIKPYIVDLGNEDGEIKVEWVCTFSGKIVCENIYDEELNIEGGFLNEGEYNISIKVTKGTNVKSDFCIVKVENDIPSIEIDTIPTPITPSSGVTIKANIYDLRTFCTLQWKSEDGPYNFDLDIIPGKVNELFNVTVRRDLFLNELEEFSDDVANKEYALIIPPPTDDWPGLPNSGKNYKLRFNLEVKCPKIQLVDNNTIIEYSDQLLQNAVSITALVEVDVDVAPNLQSLEIEPPSGIAMETVFSFKTSEALPTGTEYPFLYKFGYKLGSREFYFRNMLEFKKTETILPYFENGVETLLEVCDSFKSCAKIYGPIIKTTLPEMINDEIILGIFKEKLNTEDYYKAFGYGLSFLYTSNFTSNEEKYQEIFSNEVSGKIEALLNSFTNEEIWAKRANKLINHISDFNEEMSFSDAVLSGLVEIRSKLLASQKQNLIAVKRKLLAINDKKSVNLESLKSYLEVSELIITSSSDKNRVKLEKEHLVEKLMNYMGKLCIELYEEQNRISTEFKTVMFVVEKLLKKSYNNIHVVPYERNSWNSTAEIKLNAETLEKTGEDKLCIGKTLFKDYFDKVGLTYGVHIFNGNDGLLIMENIDSMVLLPVDLSKTSNKTPKCIVYNKEWQSNCKFVKLASIYAQCSCTTLGNYYLEYEDVQPPTTTTTTTTTTATIKTVIITEVPKATERSTEIQSPDDITTITTVVDNNKKNTTQYSASYINPTLTTKLSDEKVESEAQITASEAEITTFIPTTSHSKSDSTIIDQSKDNLSTTEKSSGQNGISRSIPTTVQNKSDNSIGQGMDNVSTTEKSSGQNDTSQSIGTENEAPIFSIANIEIPDTITNNINTTLLNTNITDSTDLVVDGVSKTINNDADLTNKDNDTVPTETVVQTNIVTEILNTDTDVLIKTTVTDKIETDLLTTNSDILTEAEVVTDVVEKTIKDTPITSPVTLINTSIIDTSTTLKPIMANEGKDDNENKNNEQNPNEATTSQVLTTTLPTTTKVKTNEQGQIDTTKQVVGGVIQGGFQANFNAGFSVNFYMNNTAVRI